MTNGETADTIHNVGKAALADWLRLLGDNQRTLDRSNVDDEASRDLHRRISEAEAREKFPHLPPPGPRREDEEMRINVDSPTTTTVNHNYPAPASTQPMPSPAKSLLAKAAPLVLAGALGASGVGLPWLLAALAAKPAAEAVVDTDTQYILDLVPGE